jgi:hypothetical protein
MVSTVGLGGLLAGRLPLERPTTAWTVAGAMTASALVVTTGVGALAVTAAQVTLALLTGLAAIRVSAVLHDAVPSSIRSGVASGVSSLSWLVFLPVALGFGALSTAHGVRAAGWLLVASAALASGLVVAVAHQQRATRTPEPDRTPVLAA